jgi:hypothetical protein
MSGTFDDDSIRRISRAVRRVERMPLNNPTDDGSEFAALPPPVFGVALIVEEVEDEYSGDAESYYADTCSGRLWRAYSLSRNGCSWDLNDQVYLFELNDTPLIPGRRYTFRAMESHFQPRSNIAETFMLGMVDIPMAGLDDQTADNYDGSVDSADSSDIYGSDVEYCDSAGPGGEVTLPLMSCDDDGNQCIKLVKFRSSGSLQICIEDPNDCNG